MSDAKIGKTDSSELEANLEDHEDERRESEEVEQQDLNQGMDTGTHDSTRHGVDWGPSYRGKKKSGSVASKRPDGKS